MGILIAILVISVLHNVVSSAYRMAKNDWAEARGWKDDPSVIGVSFILGVTVFALWWWYAIAVGPIMLGWIVSAGIIVPFIVAVGYVSKK